MKFFKLLLCFSFILVLVLSSNMGGDKNATGEKKIKGRGAFAEGEDFGDFDWGDEGEEEESTEIVFEDCSEPSNEEEDTEIIYESCPTGQTLVTVSVEEETIEEDSESEGNDD